MDKSSKEKQADPIGTQLIQLLPCSKSQCACNAFQSALVAGSALLRIAHQKLTWPAMIST